MRRTNESDARLLFFISDSAEPLCSCRGDRAPDERVGESSLLDNAESLEAGELFVSCETRRVS